MSLATLALLATLVTLAALVTLGAERQQQTQHGRDKEDREEIRGFDWNTGGGGGAMKIRGGAVQVL